MTDTTTPKDLATKIEWIGLRNLSHAERAAVGSNLTEISRFLPRLLALAVWSYFGERPPAHLMTRSSESSVRSFYDRERSKSFIKELMADFHEEENPR